MARQYSHPPTAILSLFKPATMKQFGLFLWSQKIGVLTLVLVIGALPLLWQLYQFYRSPKPEEAPKGYRGWPLWFVAIAFIHNRRFGMLFIAGLALQLAINEVV